MKTQGPGILKVYERYIYVILIYYIDSWPDWNITGILQLNGLLEVD